jgi:circadian clock protein KaiC
MERAGTGIPDLDLTLGGGMPLGSLLFVAGGSGTGKTILAQQICFANATAERKALDHTMISERWLRVLKLRGTDYLMGKHSFRISTSGLGVFPRF